jgi:hypothetical protein
VTIKNAPHFQEVRKSDHVTIVACINAAGVALPPLVVFKGKSILRRETNGLRLVHQKMVDGHEIATSFVI